ncbi:PH domain-containing protein [Dermatophilus congolensis]|uniref:PH domain-containing protein n=1 Tax=Dermatophilus congolensis TaxID=1863 RepID=UPI001AB00552|nr:PH domain-containing protein [Dermatophilus congolensis]MBO3201956.1 PH domain-containing protein [Dermatophilus congolensis]
MRAIPAASGAVFVAVGVSSGSIHLPGPAVMYQILATLVVITCFLEPFYNYFFVELIISSGKITRRHGIFSRTSQAVLRENIDTIQSEVTWDLKIFHLQKITIAVKGEKEASITFPAISAKDAVLHDALRQYREKSQQPQLPSDESKESAAVSFTPGAQELVATGVNSIVMIAIIGVGLGNSFHELTQQAVQYGLIESTSMHMLLPSMGLFIILGLAVRVYITYGGLGILIDKHGKVTFSSGCIEKVSMTVSRENICGMQLQRTLADVLLGTVQITGFTGRVESQDQRSLQCPSIRLDVAAELCSLLAPKLESHVLHSAKKPQWFSSLLLVLVAAILVSLMLSQQGASIRIFSFLLTIVAGDLILCITTARWKELDDEWILWSSQGLRSRKVVLPKSSLASVADYRHALLPIGVQASTFSAARRLRFYCIIFRKNLISKGVPHGCVTG